MALPRLTGAIRAFGDVCALGETQGGTDRELTHKRRQVAALKAEEGLTWGKLARTVRQAASADERQVNNSLRDLINAARDMSEFR